MDKRIPICIPVAEKTSTDAIRASKDYQRMGADLLEFRIDFLDEPDVDMVKEVLEDIELPVIATNRVSSEGGYFKGSEEERINLLLAAASQADYVDVELNTSNHLRDKVIQASPQTIISYHNFHKTPSLLTLRKIIEKEKKLGDLAKFAVTPLNWEDSLKVLNLTLEYEGTLGLAMGEYGKYTRVLAPLFGAPFTYASGDRVTAPGQMDLKTTRFILDQFMLKNND